MFASSLDEYIESYRNRNSNLTSKNMNQEAGTQESCMIFRVFFNLQYAGLVPLEIWLAPSVYWVIPVAMAKAFACTPWRPLSGWNLA